MGNNMFQADQTVLHDTEVLLVLIYKSNNMKKQIVNTVYIANRTLMIRVKLELLSWLVANQLAIESMTKEFNLWLLVPA